MSFFHIIYNPAAGGGTAGQAWQVVKSELTARNISFSVKTSKYSGHAVELAHYIGLHAANATDVLLVIGGDGSLNQAITGLRTSGNTALPVAYIPAGSGNDFARTHHISNDPLTALQSILALLAPVSVDIGHYHEHNHEHDGYFVNNLGVGFDAAVVYASNQNHIKHFLNKLHLGTLTYLTSMFSVFVNRRPFPVSVTAADQHDLITKAFLCVTTNAPFFGGGIEIMPGASVVDGELDLIVVESLNAASFLFLFAQMLRGKHLQYPTVHHYRATTIRVTSDSVEFGHADGEELGSAAYDLEFSVEKQLFLLANAN